MPSERKIVMTKPEHEVLYQDLIALVGKHGDKVTSIEMLAIAANMIGKLMAMQDQRVVTRGLALKILIANLEFGNKTMIEELLRKTKGSG